MTVVYFYTSKHTSETQFALVRENLSIRVHKFRCSDRYEKEISKFPLCVPKKCGRFVSDKLVDEKDVETLLDMSQKIFELGGSSGGASVLDIHTGALSYGEKYLNFYRMPEARKFLKPEHLSVYNVRGNSTNYLCISQLHQFITSSKLKVKYNWLLLNNLELSMHICI